MYSLSLRLQNLKRFARHTTTVRLDRLPRSDFWPETSLRPEPLADLASIYKASGISARFKTQQILVALSGCARTVVLCSEMIKETAFWDVARGGEILLQSDRCWRLSVFCKFLNIFVPDGLFRVSTVTADLVEGFQPFAPTKHDGPCSGADRSSDTCWGWSDWPSRVPNSSAISS
jgi:hypothetical protein